MSAFVKCVDHICPLHAQRTIVSLLRQAMENRTNVPGFLLDGFPRELEQAELFEKEVCCVCVCVCMLE